MKKERTRRREGVGAPQRSAQTAQETSLRCWLRGGANFASGALTGLHGVQEIAKQDRALWAFSLQGHGGGVDDNVQNVTAGKPF